MNIGIVVFNNFTDLDFYLPWDLLNRVRLLKLKDDWKVEILSDLPEVISATGLKLQTTKPLSFANECNGVFFCSGYETRKLIANEKFLQNFKLDESRQVIAAIDSGALILAALGLLQKKKATTYPTAFDLLAELGAQVEKDQPFISEGNVATAARCLSGDRLALWIIERLAGSEISKQVFDAVKPLGN
jgi:transcriptional regulator GlxA family with amidase domain